MRHILALLLLFPALALGAGSAMEHTDGSAASTSSVPTGVANIQTDSCSTSDCTATATCDSGTIVLSAISRQDSTTCTGALSGLTGSFIRLDCYGNGSCAQQESGVGNAACVRISCAPN